MMGWLSASLTYHEALQHMVYFQAIQRLLEPFHVAEAPRHGPMALTAQEHRLAPPACPAQHGISIHVHLVGTQQRKRSLRMRDQQPPQGDGVIHACMAHLPGVQPACGQFQQRGHARHRAG